MTLKFSAGDDQSRDSHAREGPSTTTNQGETDQQTVTLPSRQGGETSKRPHPESGFLCPSGANTSASDAQSNLGTAASNVQPDPDTNEGSLNADVTVYDSRDYSHNASEFVKSEVANAQRAFADFAAQRAPDKQAKD